MDNETIYKALKKCNNIGKKMGSGSYILVDGILMAESFVEEDDTKSVPFSIAFLDDKTISQLDALSYIGLEIDGLKLYEYSNQYDFGGFTIGNDSIDIIFNTTYEDNKGYINKFKDILRSKGYTDDQIAFHEFSMYKSDINVYEEYIKYKKNNKPEQIATTISLPMKIIDKDNYFLKNGNRIIDSLSNQNLLYEKELVSEVYNEILDSKSPMELSVGDIKIRLMKSVFVTGSTKSDASILLYDTPKKDILYMVIKITTSSITVCNIYKIHNY